MQATTRKSVTVYVRKKKTWDNKDYPESIETCGGKLLLSKSRGKNSNFIFPAKRFVKSQSTQIPLTTLLVQSSNDFFFHFLCNHQIYDLLMLHVGGQRDEFDSRYGTYNIQPLVSQERHKTSRNSLKKLIFKPLTKLVTHFIFFWQVGGILA